MTTGRGVVRPETILYELGTHIQTLPAMDGGVDRELDAIAGIIIGVADRPDRVTGELVRTFEVLVTTTTRELLVRWVPESWLELGAAYPAQTAQLRTARRNVARWIAGRRSLTDSWTPSSPLPGSMAVLLEAEQGRMTTGLRGSAICRLLAFLRSPRRGPVG